jgi:hypothetical protein
MHEASLYDSNIFITLTYDDDNLPPSNSLVRKDVTDFLKRLRQYAVRSCGKYIRVYGCGEYGELFFRPHYHLCIFNFDFVDKKKFRVSPRGDVIYKSDRLEKLWDFGFSEIGSVTFDSAGYVARYCLKKITGDKADEHYHYVDAEGRSHYLLPEFPIMSLKPGIGQPWLDKFHSDVYNYDFVRVGNRKMRPPRYYDNWFEIKYPSDFNTVEQERKRKARALGKRDNSYRKYLVREEVSKSGLSTFSKRSL